MSYEAWIWTELLAFDKNMTDQGVKEYLERIGEKPKGISLMLSTWDFVLLHDGMEKEYTLFPEVCARFGQKGNEERGRQEWTNYQLRSLIKNLQDAGIETFFSIFGLYYFHNRYHKEWASDHPEALVAQDGGLNDGYSLIARLSDGTYVEDIFVEKLEQVMLDYNFDGFHGADHTGPGGVIAHMDCSDNMTEQFAEYLGTECPNQLHQKAGTNGELLTRRMSFIWQAFRIEWTYFNSQRWIQCWGKIVALMKKLKKKSMINSSNTKGALESITTYGLDYSEIARLGVDYLVVETVAPGLALINGGHPYRYDFAATLAELKAFTPGMKIIFLHVVKDVVESYDIIRHAPASIEQEVFRLSNYFIDDGKELARCAEGFLVCLGDGLSKDEWNFLRQQWQIGYSFNPVWAGDFTWVWDSEPIHRHVIEYHKNGAWPAFKQIGELTQHYDLRIQTIARFESLKDLTGPLIVPNADLLTKEKRNELFAYANAPVIALGMIPEEDIPLMASTILCRIGTSYIMRCVITDGKGRKCEVHSSEQMFRSDRQLEIPFTNQQSYLSIPHEFWDTVFEFVKEFRRDSVRALSPKGALRLLAEQDVSGVLRTALLSTQQPYLVPEWSFGKTPKTVRKVSNFPYTALGIRDGKIGTGANYTPLHIPPQGIIVLDTVSVE